MDESHIQQGLEELWSKGQVKSDWQLKIYTLDHVTDLVSRLPLSYARKSDFLADKVTPPLKVPEHIDQEPSREWCSLLALPQGEKSRATALQKFTQDMELTPGWVCSCTCNP